MIKNILAKTLWVLAGVAFALVLLVAATAICAVRLLKSEQLTPIVCSLAEDNLDASVDIGAIHLSFNPGYPILRLLSLMHSSEPTRLRRISYAWFC